MGAMRKVINGGGSALSRCVLAVLLALCMCMGPVSSAYAADAPWGTLTLECSYGSGDEARVFAGDSFEAVRIADAQVGDGSAQDLSFALLEGFEALDCEWAALSASQLHGKALEAVDLIAQGSSGVDARVAQADASGVARFSSVLAGIYLVQRVAVASGNEAYTCDPFIVFVPELVDGAAIYQVTAYPKFGFSDEPGQPGDPGQPGNPGDTPPSSEEEGPHGIWETLFPETGDFGWGGLILAAIGISVVVVIATRKPARRGDHEK